MINEMWPAIESFVNQELEKSNPFTIFSGDFSEKFSLGTGFLDELIKTAREKGANFKIKPSSTSNDYPEDSHENYFDIKFIKIS